MAKQTTIQGQDIAKALAEREITIKQLESKILSLKNRLKESENEENKSKFDALVYCAGAEYYPVEVFDVNSYVKARFDRLCATLRKYGKHSGECKWPLLDCTCGLSEVFNDYRMKE